MHAWRKTRMCLHERTCKVRLIRKAQWGICSLWWVLGLLRRHLITLSQTTHACINYLQVASSKPALRMFNCILLHLVFYNKATKDGAKRKSFQFACYLHVRVSAFWKQVKQETRIRLSSNHAKQGKLSMSVKHKHMQDWTPFLQWSLGYHFSVIQVVGWHKYMIGGTEPPRFRNSTVWIFKFLPWS